jgi:hypothetical protein
MESGIYLSALVFGIGVAHLAVRAASFFNGRKSADTAGKHTDTRRDDWYMFFHRSQLTGCKEDDLYPCQSGMAKKKKVVRQPQRAQKRAQVRM